MNIETEYDPELGGAVIINETDIPDDKVLAAIREHHPELASLTRWAQGLRPRPSQQIFSRDKFVAPDGVFNEIRVAQYLAEWDDVVSNVVNTTEQIAFNRVVIECDDKDEEDIWRQIMEDLQIEQRMREIWRERFITSTANVAVWFGKPDEPYKVSGKSKSGRSRKRTFDGLEVPLALSCLDPLKVVPVGNFMFGQERLAYIANRYEQAALERTLAGPNSGDLDVVAAGLIEKQYKPDPEELRLLQEACGKTDISQITANNLWLLKKDRVFRTCATRSSYERFPAVRMKSVFELMDMKAQLRQMDMAFLLGGSNFIVLVKKGSDHMPAKQSEVDRLASQVRTAARIPILITDHRVEIEIITPDLNHMLNPDRYNAINSWLTANLYQMFSTGATSSGKSSDDSIKLLRIVARSMEARRNEIRDAIMRHVILPTYRRNDQLKSEPKMRFYPGRISLDFDPNLATYLLDMHDRGKVSATTALAEVDLNIADEAQKREREDDLYDDILGPVPVPFSGPPPGAGDGESSNPPGNTKGAGRAGGGNSGGGGMNRQSQRSGPPRGAGKEAAPKRAKPSDK